jgi:hypothetical protein
LAEQALVFTQHPGYLPLAAGEPIPPDWNWQREDEPGPGYWTGEASQPRAAQVENVTIAIYSPQYQQNADLGFPMRQETHAYFPHAHFDEVVQEGNWTFGRKGDAYVALYSWRATEWRDGQPEVFQNAGLPFDLVAPGGAKNVWITECGSIEEWPGGFAAFRAAIGAASVDVTETAIAFDVSYVSPTQGTLDLGWEGPLMRDGNPEALSGYPRFDNPFAQVAFPTEGAQDMVYVISDGEYGLMLDFPNDSRTVSAPPDVIGQNHTTFHEVTQDVLDYLDARF